MFIFAQTTYSEQPVITQNETLHPITEDPIHVNAIELDGDVDRISVSQSDNDIAWDENDGIGISGEERNITDSLPVTQSVFAVDLNGNAKMDTLSTSVMEDKKTRKKPILFTLFEDDFHIFLLLYLFVVVRING
jgi:hypothetical protein